jgi:hypothetical protein
MKTFSTVLLVFTTALYTHAQFDSNGFRMQQRSEKAMMDNYKDGRSQGKQMRGYLGYDIGVFYSFADRNYIHTYNHIDDNGTNLGEVTHRVKLKSAVIGFNAGSYIPMGNLGSTSCLALDWGIAATIYNGSTGRITTARGGTYQYSIMNWQFMVPLCLDFKYGGEAIYDKSERFSFTMGAGLIPSLSVVAISGALSSAHKIAGRISPVIKAELGFFAGLEWKVKASYVYRKGNDLKSTPEDSKSGPGPDGSIFTLTTTPAINIGVSFMPFSHDWDSSRW